MGHSTATRDRWSDNGDDWWAGLVYSTDMLDKGMSPVLGMGRDGPRLHHATRSGCSLKLMNYWLRIRTIFHELTTKTGVSWTKFWDMLFCSFPNSLKDTVYNWLYLTWKVLERSIQISGYYFFTTLLSRHLAPGTVTRILYSSFSHNYSHALVLELGFGILGPRF